MIAELERRTREEFDNDEATHLDYVVQWVEGGGTVVGLLAAMDQDVKRGMLMKYLEQQYGAEVSRRLSEARVEGAHALVEDAAEIVEEARADKDSIALAKLRADTKTWIAGRWNRQAYGEPKQGVQLQINMGSAFLEALRRRAEEARVETNRARAFRSDGADSSAHLEGTSAIAGAIAQPAQDVSFEILES